MFSVSSYSHLKNGWPCQALVSLIKTCAEYHGQTVVLTMQVKAGGSAQARAKALATAIAQVSDQLLLVDLANLAELL